MASSGSDVERSPGRFEEIVAGYVRACDDGCPPDREQLINEHADLADELRNFFRLRERTEELLKPLRSAATRVLNIRCPHCRNSIELLDDSDVHSIRCSSCGSDFSLVDLSEGALPGGLERIGQFQFVEQVGVGQFGVVWKARDLSLERTVAVKIPRSRQLHASEVEILLRDARVAAQLNHPHIVSVHEVGKYDDLIYIVSDFIEGASLKEWLATNRPTVQESARLCATISEAVHYAHECGVVHRDLKPGNIIVDPAGEPHVVDFGLAKREAGELTMTIDGQILGTPAYMSPEQASGRGHKVSRTADVYSLGVILFEMLTGQLPFQGSRPALLVQIINDRPTNPRSLNSKIPRDLETICLKCLEKQPRDRYQTARELADDCRRYLAGEPVQARPLSTPVKAYRWSRKNPWLAGLWATCALLLVGLAIVASIGYLQTQMALRLANQRADTIERNLYFAEMSSAGRAAMNSNGLAEVQRLLAHWDPEDSQVDRRGWEWYYLDSLLHEDLATLRGHDGGISKLAFSPDGQWLASSGYDWSVRIWASDGKSRHVLTDHLGVVNDLTWNPDGTQLATASDDGTVNIWDTSHGQLIHTLQHQEPVSAVAWSPAGNRIATANSASTDDGDGTGVTIWNTSTWKVERRFDLSVDAVKFLRWNPQSDQLAVAPQRGQIMLIDARTGHKMARFGDTEHSAECLEWNHDGSQLAYSYYAGESLLYIWRAEDPDQIQIQTGAAVAAVAWHPHEPELAYVDGDKTVKLHNVGSNSEVGQLRGHESRVTAVCWHPQGERVATADIDGKIKIWNASPPPQFSHGAATISWHPDGTHYASRIGETVILSDAKSPSSPPISLYKHEYNVVGVAWSPDGATLASISYDGLLHLWDAASRTSRQSVQERLTWSGSRLPRLLAWSPDCRHLAMPHDDRDIQILDTATEQIVRVLPSDGQQLLSLAWSPNGEHLASGGLDGTLRLWNPDSGAEVARMGNPSLNSHINSISWHPGGSQLACATSETGVVVWRLGDDSGWRYLRGHTTYVHSVAWSPDGARIASADESGSVRIWDAESGQMTLSLQYPGGVPDLAWSPDGGSLAAVGYGGEEAVRIWSTTVDPTPAVLW